MAASPQLFVSYRQALWAQGDLPGARALVERVLDVSRRRVGEEHPETMDAATGVLAIACAQKDTDGIQRLLKSSPPAVADKLRAWLDAQPPGSE
jgi:hypothetical protein